MNNVDNIMDQDQKQMYSKNTDTLTESKTL